MTDLEVSQRAWEDSQKDLRPVTLPREASLRSGRPVRKSGGQPEGLGGQTEGLKVRGALDDSVEM